MSTMFVLEDPEQGRRVLNVALPIAADGVTVADNWDTLGMRGTQSRTTELHGAVAPADRIVRHDPTDLGLAFALSRLDDPSFKHVPMGIFRQVDAPTYDDGVRAQIEQATGGEQVADAELQQLLDGSDTWDVQGRSAD